MGERGGERRGRVLEACGPHMRNLLLPPMGGGAGERLRTTHVVEGLMEGSVRPSRTDRGWGVWGFGFRGLGVGGWVWGLGLGVWIHDLGFGGLFGPLV